MNKNKIEKGQFYTVQNPFTLAPFRSWLTSIPDYKNLKYIEPYAGANNIVKMFQQMGYNFDWKSFDVEPQADEVLVNDSIKNFPIGFNICITNPPYLAKNSAKRKKMKFPKTSYDDLYKLALEKCFSCQYVAAIIPESFITANLFHQYLEKVIILNFNMFDDTEHPVCLALFNTKKATFDFEIFQGDKRIGRYQTLQSFLPVRATRNINLNFNDKDGELGLIAIDSVSREKVSFCDGSRIPKESIKVSSRSNTRIKIEPSTLALFGNIDNLVFALNKELNAMRMKTHDVFMTSFKGLRNDGRYRRRLDFALARDIIEQVVEKKVRGEI